MYLLEMSRKGVIHKASPHIFAGFQPPPSPYSRFLLSNPCPVQTLSWKTNKELQQLSKNKNSLKMTYFLFAILFLNLLRRLMMIKCPLYPPFSLTEITLKRMSTHSYTPPSPCSLLSVLFLTPSLPQRTGILYGYPQNIVYLRSTYNVRFD